MRLVVQRCSRAAVRVGEEVVGSIEHGAVVLVAVARDDREEQADWLAQKLSKLRIYDDHEGRLNAPIQDTDGAFLVISQFTLYADCRKGNRPSYLQSAPPDHARSLYEYFVNALRAMGHRVETGRFQETMAVELVNDGPVTLILERS